MKYSVLVFLILARLGASAQMVSATPSASVDTTLPSFAEKSTIISVSVGMPNNYRSAYNYPTGFRQGTITGFMPVYGRVEYAVSRKVSIGAMLVYDVFYNNYYQLYYGNGNTFSRNRKDKVSLLNYGLAGWYHFGSIIPVKNLDVYAGLGLTLNKITHSNLPQGDSTVATKENTASPYIKAGARYFISRSASVFADAGYDNHTIFNIGFSCRFTKSPAKK